MSSMENTVKYTGDELEEQKIRDVLSKVYSSLEEKGYNPINQIAGYLLSGDPAYITSYNNARALIHQIDRDDIVRQLVKTYLK
ncbi:MAG: IreB family regulatory phosphoprotein [Fusobacteria bacterium]|nr:IreB family regulatory phosphoprotein [Fusobacteriota bacterium]